MAPKDEERAGWMEGGVREGEGGVGLVRVLAWLLRTREKKTTNKDKLPSYDQSKKLTTRRHFYLNAFSVIFLSNGKPKLLGN